MDKKQKALLIGGGLATVAAVLLISSTSKAATKGGVQPVKPNQPPKPVPPGPAPVIDPHGVPGKPTTPIDSPFGKFVPCTNGICPEPYKSQIVSAINASFDFYKLDQAGSTYQQNGCIDLANAVRARYATLKGGLASLPQVGTVDSPCDYGGNMVQANNDQAVRDWIDQLTDADLAASAAEALLRAQPPCTSLANYAKTKAENLHVANQAVQETAGSVKDAAGSIVDWFTGN